MPRKASYTTHPDQRRAPAAIGERLRSRREDLGLAELTLALGLLVSARMLLDDLPRKVIFDDDCFDRPMDSLVALYRVVRFEETDPQHTVKQLWDIPEKLTLAPSDTELGRCFLEKLEGCLHGIPQTDVPHDNELPHIVVRLFQGLFEKILERLRQQKIVGMCEYCSKPFFSASPKKRFCSVDYEGRNCSANQRSQKSYQKRKTTRQKQRIKKPDSN